MDWSAELEASHTDLSEADWQFREFARHDPECLSRFAFKEIDQPQIRIFGRLQPWPTFMQQKKVRELADAGVAVSQLIKSIPERIFQNDPQKINDYYGLANPELTALYISPPNGISGALSRGDFVCTRSGFKCLECNMSGNLGGMEADITAGALLGVPVVDRFIRRLQPAVSVADTAGALLTHVIREAQAAGDCANECNVIIGLPLKIDPAGTSAILALFDQKYAAALREVSSSAEGSIALSDYSDISLRQSALYSGKKRIHAIVEYHENAGRPATSLAAFKAGKLQLYNGPLIHILSDKRNLALLSELGESELFDVSEKARIRRFIPWTRRIRAEPTTYENESVLPRDFLVAERGRMVIKKALSLGGKAVKIGRFTPKDEWIQAVNEAIDAGDWIAQEHVESLPYLFQEGDYGCVPHDVIWGPFVFGETYGGTITRMVPKCIEGVVNLAQGATMGTLVELDI